MSFECEDREGQEVLRNPSEQSLESLNALHTLDKLESIESKDLPPSPCRGRSDTHLDLDQRETELKLREKALSERSQSLDFREFLLQEEKQQHQENLRLLAQRTGALEDREARILEQERRRPALSGSASSAGGTPPSSSKKFRRQSPLVSTPPQKQMGYSESMAQDSIHEAHFLTSSQAVSEVSMIQERMRTSSDEDDSVLMPMKSEKAEEPNDEGIVSGLRQPELAESETCSSLASKVAINQSGQEEDIEQTQARSKGPNGHNDDVSNSELKQPELTRCGLKQQELSERLPKPMKKTRRRTLTSRLIGILYSAVWLQVAIKVVVFLGIIISPQLRTATGQHVAMWLPAVFKDFRHGPIEINPMSSLISHPEQCQMALHKLRTDLAQLHTRKASFTPPQ
jgi:hypothetical protein